MGKKVAPVRLEESTIKALDMLAEFIGTNRSQLIRKYIQMGMHKDITNVQKAKDKLDE